MPHPRALAAAIPTTTAALFLAACGEKEQPAPAPSQGTTQQSSGASIMLRGSYAPPPGAELRVRQTLSVDKADILQRIGENETTGKMSITQTERQTVRFGEAGVREIIVGEGGSTLTTSFAEFVPIEESHPDELAGKTVVAKPTPDGSWDYTIQGEPGGPAPAGFQAADLRSDELYPQGWKDLGETWSPEPSAVGALLGPGFQLSEGKITMRLLGYSKRRGQPCGEIAADIDAKGLFQSGDARQDVSIRLKGKIYRSLDLFRDLEADLKGTIEMYQRVGNTDIRIEGPVRLRREADYVAQPASEQEAS